MDTDLITRLERHVGQLDSLAPSVNELLAGFDPDVETAVLQPEKGPHRRVWAVAVAVGVVVLLAVGLLPLIGRSPDVAEPAPEPDSAVEQLLGSLNALDPDDLPPVRLTLSFDSGPIPIMEGEASLSGIAEITYIPSTGYRLDMVEGHADVASGSYLAWDGTWVGFHRIELDDPTTMPPSRFRQASPMYPPNWQTDFSRFCDAGSTTLLGPDVVAGLRVTGLQCSPLRGDWTLWVHEETGLVLRLDGSYGVGGEVGLAIGRDGGFEATEVLLAPAVDVSVFDVSDLPDLNEPSVSPTPELPRFRALVSTSLTADFGPSGRETKSATLEVRYEAADRWRVDVVDGIGWMFEDLAPGSYRVQVGGEFAQFDIGGRYSYDVQKDAAEPGHTPLNQLFERRRVGAYDTCGDPSEGERLGRAVVGYQCTMPGTEDPLLLILDFDTHLVLFEEWRGEQSGEGDSFFEVLEFEIEPTFPAGTFAIPEPSNVHALVGEPAPPLRVPLLNGSPFDLADLRGQRVAVLFAVAQWCGPCLDAVVDFQEAADTYGESAAFVAVAAYDERAAVADVVDRGGLTMLVPFDEEGTTVGDWVVSSIPTIFLIDRDGIVVDVLEGYREGDSIVEFLLSVDW